MLGIGILVLGLIHYLLLRGELPFYGIEFKSYLIHISWVPNWFLDSFPTFAFVAGVSALEFSILFELFQLVLAVPGLSGIFDIRDLFAAFWGGLFTLVVTNLKGKATSSVFRKFSVKTAQLSIYGLAFIMITATSTKHPHYTCKEDTKSREYARSKRSIPGCHHSLSIPSPHDYKTTNY